jgi:hypothetical protein
MYRPPVPPSSKRRAALRLMLKVLHREFIRSRMRTTHDERMACC